MADEMIDLLNEEGRYTGKQVLKSVAHREGLFHPTVHIWCYTEAGRVLLQQRGKNKDTYPLLWDVSVAGHVGSGEDLKTAAVREVAEEIGLSIDPDALEQIGVFKSMQHPREDLKDYEYHHCYLYKLINPGLRLVKQESEVENLKWMPLLQFAEEVWGMANPSVYVPHSTAYYAAVIKAIKERL